MQATTITPTVDFERDGKQHGFLKLPYSSDQSAWGCIMIPVTVVKNGEGPTALLTGGNHGDEYEGITALFKLANSLEPEQVRGRVIIVPAMNYPAVRNGSRTSPIDKGNMNRSFPGNPAGSMTERIADYFNRYLVPMCDYALDIHSGGKTLDFIPFSAAHRLPDPAQEAACIEGAKLFGAPNVVVMFELDTASLYDTAVESQGKVFVTTELCGGGTSSPETIALADRGVHNFLIFAGITRGDYRLPDTPPRLLDMPDGSCYMMSEHQGLLELCVSLGDRVRAGDLVARIHSLERTGQPPAEYRAKRDGILAGRRHPALIDIGDTFAVLAVELDA
ncbi:N-alpha-acetyl diaminobutyric acid deacetylase DoeB [Zobellella denitrificans]|uniref:Deacylase n=1 Tax=Zobellella denitrificans TaxID=347534 RepID=A0A231N1V4_9GAMM|nr:N(2)-acetyl-L-2,4-diaminobutanoate deacetylase DoeB [Zobellella denitrificans]ATG72830.1 deacylase [Zobellella denitrificans]OXS16474.1 N-alpha-acetyl diaminobutyric acid deacetylase DoeB [Zobellella denitrificans]